MFVTSDVSVSFVWIIPSLICSFINYKCLINSYISYWNPERFFLTPPKYSSVNFFTLHFLYDYFSLLFLFMKFSICPFQYLFYYSPFYSYLFIFDKFFIPLVDGYIITIIVTLLITWKVQNRIICINSHYKI